MTGQPDGGPPGLLDRLVEFLASSMNALGLNGTRLRWKWNRQRSRWAESGERATNLWRSTKSKHKMCPSCRALVPRGCSRCDECGRELAGVRAPGIGRLVANLLPGATAATSLILLTNGFWFLMTMMAQMKLAGGGGFGLLSGFSGELLYRFGSGWSGATLNGEWWRVVTPIFLHGGILHFFFNSYVLLQIGPLVEDEYGTERFWVIYLLCGIAGASASQFLRPVNTVGASGALLGMMGLLLVHGWRRGGPTGQALKGAMIRWGVYIAIFGLLLPGIDNINHLGGFVSGAALGFVAGWGPSRGRGRRRVWNMAAGAGVLLVLFSFYMVASTAVS
ncbi:MAG TPA: rhomboid family intramembrane serine protease [Candidatus Polarisedimenticolaceae bacterium]|nr:rhomboid family intramembrane serine protease [Candidatus Polarisedimenticolaceae bacterium]